MKCTISNELVLMFKKTNKNINYMLDYLLSAIDSRNCKQYFQLLIDLTISGEKTEIEISETNIQYTRSIFGYIKDELIERLLWVALLFQEV